MPSPETDHAGLRESKTSAERWDPANARIHAGDLRQPKHETLRQQEALTAALYDTVPVGLCLLDPGLRYVRINEKLAALHGRPAGDHLGCDYRTMVSPEFASAAERLFCQVLRTGVPVTRHEISAPMGCGAREERDWLLGCAVVATHDGTVIGLQVIVEDATERKHGEQSLAEANQKLREFACIAAHDLQEPLRTIVSYSELVRHKSKGLLTPDCDAHLCRVIDAAQRMSRLISDVLRYSRETVSGQATFSTVHLNAVVDSTVDMLGSLIDESGATVVRSRLPVVTGDAVRLGQVFENLICNAIKYRRPGVTPKIRIGVQAKNGGCLISVQDNGQGFRQEYAEEVFGVFKRLHGPGVPGSGIGLAICKSVVEDHGGRIWAESAEGQGTTVYFTLPARRRTGPRMHDRAAAAAG